MSRFHDATIAQRFVWKKKIETELQKSDVDVTRFTAKAERERMDSRMKEIDEVRRRREQREAEKAQIEEELKFLERERARAEGTVLDRKEEEYHLANARVRAEIRLKEGRPEPFDLVLKNLFMAEEFGMDLEPPLALFKGMNAKKLADVARDVASYRALNQDEGDDLRDYWAALATVVEHELAEARRSEGLERAQNFHGGGGAEKRAELERAQFEAGFHAQVDADVQALFAGKSFRELAALESEIQGTLEEGSVPDPEYWEAVLRRLAVHKSRALLTDVHSENLSQYMAARAAAREREEAERRAAGHEVAEARGFEDEEEVVVRPQGQAAAVGAANAEEIDIDDLEEEDPRGDGAAPGSAAAAAAPAPEAGPSVPSVPPPVVDEALRGLSPEPEIPRRAIATLVREDMADPRTPPPITDPEDDLRELRFLRAKVAFEAAQKFTQAAGGVPAALGAVGASNRVSRCFHALQSTFPFLSTPVYLGTYGS